MRLTGQTAVRPPDPDCQAGTVKRHGTMATKQGTALPKIGRHSSGQARVTIGGKVYYLGPYGSLEAQQAYTRLVERWEANGRALSTSRPPWRRCAARRTRSTST